MNETQPTQPIQPAQHVDAVEQPNTTPTKTAFWRRKPVWITAIVVGSLALGGAGAAYAMDEFDDDDRSTSATGQRAADAGRDDDGSSELGDSAARSDSDARDTQDADDVPLTDAEYTDASDAALAEAKGGSVTDVDRSDDPGVAFEVDVLLANGDELEVDLGADFSVVRTVLDPRS